MWEIRTSGNDASGGGFDPAVASAGTDYSQQDAPQLSYTDLVIGGTNTTLTSAAKPFTAAHVGNTVRVTGGTGFTVGSYSIRSVAGAVATMDRAVGTAASTGGTGHLGGALASPGMAAGLVVTGNTAWIRSGTYMIGNGTANTAGQKVASAAASTIWEGYGTTRGDGGPPPRLQATASSMTLFAVTQSFATVRNLEAYRDPAGGLTAVVGFSIGGTASAGRRLRATNLNGSAAIVGAAAAGELAECLGTGCNCTGGAFQVSANGMRVRDCASLQTGGARGFQSLSAEGTTYLRCVAGGDGTLQYGFAASTGSTVTLFESCVAHRATTVGFEIWSRSVVDRCLAHTAATGFNSSAASNRMTSCASFGHSAAAVAGTFAPNEGFLTCTEDPCTDAANGDFTLNALAGGGALLKGIAHTLPGLAGVGRRDVGAYQSAGGGTAYYAM